MGDENQGLGWLKEIRECRAVLYMPDQDIHWMMFITEGELIGWGQWLISRELLKDRIDEFKEEISKMEVLLLDENVDAIERVSRVLDWCMEEVLPYPSDDKLYDYHTLIEDPEWQERFDEFLTERGLKPVPMTESLALAEEMLFSDGVTSWSRPEPKRK